MSDYDLSRPARPESEETFQPGVSITPDGVSLFVAGFRAQELQAGVLVDVSETAQEVGFQLPVAVTRSLWADIQAVPAVYAHEDVPGRLWDVLSMAKLAVRQAAPGGAEVRFNLVLHVGDTSVYLVRLVYEPGDDDTPVITLSSPEKDIDLELGEIVLTEGALDAFVSAHLSPTLYLLRHRRGDWGELDAEDITANNLAARRGHRVLSAYTLPPTQQKIWIISEYDRSVSTILLPDEY
jgi:hypothetical protein